MKGSKFVVLTEQADGGDVVIDAEAGVAAMRGIDDQLEEFFPQRHVRRLDEGAAAIDVGEGSELSGAEKLDVPAFDTGA